MAPPGSIHVLQPPAPVAVAEKEYDLMYYLKGAAAGGICCSITHGALTPVDGTLCVCCSTVVFGWEQCSRGECYAHTSHRPIHFFFSPLRSGQDTRAARPC